MKFKWIIQNTGLITTQIYKKFDALNSLGENISGVGVIKEEDYIIGLSEAIEKDLDTKYILLCGVKVLNLLNKAKNISDVLDEASEFHIKNSDKILKSLKEGFFYDYTKFDQVYYSQLGLPLLNRTAEYISVADNLDKSFDIDKFVKPSRDLKAFDAGIIKAGVRIGDYLEKKSRQRFYLEEQLVVSDVLEMCDEYRFFVVNKKVVSGSAYRVSGKLGISTIVPDQVLREAEKLATKYQPAEIFTMDLARLKNEEISIIEYNCFNCSGVYANDMVKTFQEIKDYIFKKSL